MKKIMAERASACALKGCKPVKNEDHTVDEEPMLCGGVGIKEECGCWSRLLQEVGCQGS
jgi:hypothetical protein